MAHPFASQAKSSQAARLKRLGGSAGKAWGSSKMYKKTGYPSKNAGSSTPMTISGGSSKSRPDRYAAGGDVKRKKRRPNATTNIIISHAGGRGGSGGGGGAGPPNPNPVPVPRPVPVPVGAGAGPAAPAPVPVRPPIAPVGAAPPAAMPPVRPPIPPGAGVGPPPGAGGLPPVRPPGMKAGGVIKKAKGGFLEMKEKVPGKTYKGYPHSPTSKVDDAVSPHKAGGGVKKRADGGGITLTKKLQLGGGAGGLGGGLGQGQAAIGSPGGSGLMGLFPGRQPVPAQQGTPNLSGRPMIPQQPMQTAQMPRMASSVLARPAPGTTATYAKKGGVIKAKDGGYHDWGVGKRKRGGSINPGSNQTARGLAGSTYHQQGKGLASGGSVKGVTNETGSAAGGKARLAKTASAKSVPAKTELG